MLPRTRNALYRVIASDRGDSLAPIRIARELARRLNTTLGRPLAQGDELAKREEARARLAELRSMGAQALRTPAEPPPILVYFEKDRNVRALTRIEELLGAKGLAWMRRDVAGDDATIEFVTRQAGCERDELPVVFVADHAVGGYEALVQADTTGELARLVRPTYPS